ncbi:MAG: hypothetical protein ABJQ29_11285 [Luteolibacter sp.]
MKTQLITALSGFILSQSLPAGGINVVHAGPGDVVKFEVTAGDASMDFTLAAGANSGSFILPEEDATIKGFHEGIPDLEVPASEDPRIAILLPSGEGFAWHLVEAKPTDDKWAFRILNVSSEMANVVTNKELIEIPAGKEKAVEVSGKAQINLKIPSTVNLTYDGSEPTGVVAFVYREDDEWKAIFLPDR